MDLLCLTCDASVNHSDNVFFLSWLYNLFTRFIEKGLRSSLQKQVRTLFYFGLFWSSLHESYGLMNRQWMPM